jgi:hypothetical protein
MSKAKTYVVEFIEFDNDESQKMNIKTHDIDFTIEQLGRNRNIDWIKYKEIKPLDEGISGPNAAYGV